MKCNQSAAKKAMQFNASQHKRHENSRPPARAHHSRSSSRSMWVNNPVSMVDASIITREHDGNHENYKLAADHHNAKD